MGVLLGTAKRSRPPRLEWISFGSATIDVGSRWSRGKVKLVKKVEGSDLEDGKRGEDLMYTCEGNRTCIKIKWQLQPQ